MTSSSSAISLRSQVRMTTSPFNVLWFLPIYTERSSHFGDFTPLPGPNYHKSLLCFVISSHLYREEFALRRFYSTPRSEWPQVSSRCSSYPADDGRSGSNAPTGHLHVLLTSQGHQSHPGGTWTVEEIPRDRDWNDHNQGWQVCWFSFVIVQQVPGQIWPGF